MGNKSKRKTGVTGNEIKCITINTDASFHPEHLTSGYAFYIICDRFKIRSGGIFKNVKPTNSKEAEIMSIGNAIATLLAQEELPACELIIINCDCLHAFELIKLKSKNEFGKKVAQLLKQLRNRMAFKDVVLPKFEFRHVKAHSGIKDARSYVNEWCDKEAKKWMRKETANKNKLEKSE